MTDIDELRQRVIDAARAWRQSEDDYDETDELVNAIDALDAALTPDPWELLRETHSFIERGGDCGPLADRIEAAIAWREKNND